MASSKFLFKFCSFLCSIFESYTDPHTCTQGHASKKSYLITNAHTGVYTFITLAKTLRVVCIYKNKTNKTEMPYYSVG